MKIYQYKILFSLLIAVFLLNGCASTGANKGSNNLVYEESFDTMVETVEEALITSSFEIISAEESIDGSEVLIAFSEIVSYRNENLQGAQGQVIIKRISDNETQVQIKNPTYHFTVPVDQRKDFRRTLSKRINNILEK